MHIRPRSATTGLLYIDTGSLEEGPAPGAETIDEPATGPSCATEAH